MFKKYTTNILIVILTLLSIYSLISEKGSIYITINLLLAVVLLVYYSFVGFRFDKVYQTIGLMMFVVSLRSVTSDKELKFVREAPINVQIGIDAMATGNCFESEQPDKTKREKFNLYRVTFANKCLLEPTKGLGNFTKNLTKTVYFGPTTGTIDNVYSLLSPSKEISCSEMFNLMDDLCPNKLPRPL